MSKRTIAAAALLLIVAATLFTVANAGGQATTAPGAPTAAACLEASLGGPEGEGGEEGGAAENEASRERSKTDLASRCGVGVPETFAELAAANQALQPRIGIDSLEEAKATAALRQTSLRRHRIVRGRWTPIGSGPLHADDPKYPETYGSGFAELNGRVADYAQGARGTTYAAVASGGVYRTTNGGKSWVSIGDSLPTQTVGSVGYSPARGGTIIAVTGDNAFGGATYGGLGVYFSTNEGRTWKRSKGVPSGAQGFKAAVDPANPKIVYAATGAGLFRSTDDARSFTNVKLPTGACAGKPLTAKNCFFANIVTDVVVQAKDRFGNEGGAVLAAVGWRDGPRKNFSGVPEAPANGLYSSDTGKPGSFKRLAAPGFAQRNRIGRVEMGVATGAAQNHDYVYAVVQDAQLFNNGSLTGLDVPDPLGLGVGQTPTVLNGIYVSANFGRTWKRMAGAADLLLPTTGSTLAQLSALGYGPGIQSWYDQWIAPDPTRQTGGGIPTRLVFGLEEIYRNRTDQPLNGPTQFQVIGPYNATGGPCILVLATDACSAAHQVTNQFTTHPDQHAGEFVPQPGGGVKLYAGNDGGAYTQTAGPSGQLTQQGFGKGANDGFHTLLPYGVAGSSDGVVYAGLQDNGEMRVEPGGRQTAIYGGDGIFTLTDPKNSDIAYEELPEAGVNVTTDGGVSWSNIDPLLDNPSFYAPLVMDPENAQHLVVGGREIAETTHGPDTTSPGDSANDWQYSFDLGTNPKTGAENQTSALAVRGAAVYAGFCGGCDVVRDKVRFSRGLATNVGGGQPPKTGSGAGWHQAGAKGLPRRFITGIAIDPRDDHTIYVTLGASDIRPYAPPKALGPSGIGRHGGHVYVSHDAGEHFRDISANLAKTPSLWALVHQGRLLVATTSGVYSKPLHARPKKRFAMLGRTLPAAPVFSLELWPGHPNRVLAASLGRGAYSFSFKR